MLVLGGSAAAALVSADRALAAPQPPAPVGDDIGFLAFGAVAEGVLVGLLHGRAGARRGVERQPSASCLGAGARAPACQRRAPQRRARPELNAIPLDSFERDRQGRLPRPARCSVGRELETLVGGVYLNGVAATRPTPGRGSSSAACSRVASRQNTLLTRLAGDSPLGGLPQPDRPRCRRPRRSTRSSRTPHRKRAPPIAGRLGARRCAPSRRRRRRAQRLRRHVADATSMPEIKRDAALLLRRLEHAPAADRARRPGRPVPLGLARRRRRRLYRAGPLRAARHVRDQQARADRPPGRPRERRSVYGLRRGGLRLVDRQRRACRSATTRAACCAGCGSAACCSRNTRLPAVQRRRRSCRRSRFGGADAGFVYVTDARTQADRVDALFRAEVGAAAGPLPGLRRAARRRRHAPARGRCSRQLRRPRGRAAC